MFSESATLYDTLYLSFKDYETEVKQIDRLIRDRAPRAKTILDIGCGTGEHARILSEQFGYRVDGIDIEHEFIQIAKKKNPSGLFLQGDMREFDLLHRYDVLLCLFGSIGYVKTIDGVGKTFRNFFRHLTDDGLIIVEPWFTPGAWKSEIVYMTTVDTNDLKICRMGYSEVKKTLSKITFEYLIGKRDGILRASEVHELGLFTVTQMKKCFTDAGLSIHFDEHGLSGRGLYLADKKV